ncbi:MULTISPECIES: polysaccharide biosynthesis tyrosine autokinase [Acidobacteriaceae]|uniref:GumC family protein n=1 Tax=Acidobacteriaceae TaxID=204434 RepID=UPI00131BE6DD|nr:MULTISPECIES: polysaccharide biosynthesis tyrosine autokinase [Acidobacteriaceae]MDW5265279.1 polysaccharide biosynthesis tyrosine autokinase [Edaphobacter sp.]
MSFQNTQPSPGGDVTGNTPPGFSTAAADNTLSEAFLTLKKRRWIVIAAVLLGFVYGIYKAKTQPKLYDAYGQIQVRSGSSNEYRLDAAQAMTGGTDTASKMLTEIQILKSDSLMLTVAREMDLANNPDFLEAKGPIAHSVLDNPSVRQATVGRLQQNLHITLVPKTEIINISYSSLNAKLAADIVNKVISAYIQRSYETRFASTQRVSQWLSSQLDDLKQQVETSQEQMMDLQRRLGILGFDPSHNQIATSLEDLSKAAGVAKLARIIAESRYRVLNGMDPDSVESSIDSGPGVAPTELNQLRTQLAAARANYAQMEATLGPNHPQSKSIKAQIAELTSAVNKEQNRLLLQAKENYVVARANEDQTNAALESQKADAYKLRDDLIEYTLRQREYEANRTLYEGLLQKLRTAGVEAGLESMEIDIVDQALLPANPTLRSGSKIVLVDVIIGLIGGIIIAFLMDSLDTGLRTIAEVESVTELPSLAVIPRSRRTSVEQGASLTAAQKNLVVLSQSKSQFAESFRALRTSLLLSTAGHPPKYILLTSATPSEGKTTLSTNLACILAQGDARVLLIDADLRRPSVHHRFGMSGKIGLTTVLTGATSLESAAQNVPEVPNLDVLPAGPMPPFPTEMLSSEAMDSLLQRCGDIYTHVLIDTPPILSVTDGVILARHADAVVLVVRHGKSSKHVVRRARDLLVRSGAPLTGIVLNAVDLNSPDYYGYYGYSGYSYSSADSGSWEPQATPAGKDRRPGETE